MTKEEILAHPADRNLDAWVSEHVFGIDATWRHWFAGSTRHYDFMDDNHVIIPKYSTDISAAWEVVDIVQEKFTLDFSLSRHIHQFEMKWISRFYDFDIDPIRVVSSTAAESICKSALIAVIEGNGEES